MCQQSQVSPLQVGTRTDKGASLLQVSHECPRSVLNLDGPPHIHTNIDVELQLLTHD